MARRITSVVLLSLSLAAVRSADAQGPPLFPGPTAWRAGASAESIAVADLNADTRPDLAVANQDSNSVSVLLADAAGGFGAPVSYGTGTAPVSVAIADFNGDGRPDLALANLSSANVSVLLGLGGGAFGAVHNYGTGGAPKCVVAADVNGDGRQDLVVASYAAHSVSVLLGKGQGGFFAAVNYDVTLLGPNTIAVADLSGDGLPDLAVGHSAMNFVSILLGQPGGTFVAGGTLPTFSVRAVSAGDLDGDGVLDLAVADHLVSAPDQVRVFEGQGGGAFGDGTPYSVAGEVQAAVMTDLDGDGLLDLAAAGTEVFGFGKVSVLLNQGGGTFPPATSYGVGDHPAALAAADLDGDGVRDLVATCKGEDTDASVFALRGLGGGLFGTAASYSTDFSMNTMALGDLTEDGLQDAVVASLFSNEVSILPGVGGGALAPAIGHVFVGGSPSALALADLTGDGHLDVLCADALMDVIVVLLGEGQGELGPLINYPIGPYPRTIALGDVDGDGQLDVAAASDVAETVLVLLGTGGGAFGSATNYPLGPYGEDAVLADVSGDGLLDLAVAVGGASTVSVLLGQGTGDFAPASTFPIAGTANAVAASDVDDDGLLDLAVSGQGTGLSGFVSVLRSQAAGAFAAAASYGTGTSASRDIAVGDVNGDGRVDLAVANVLASTVSQLLGQGGGAFGAATSRGICPRPATIALADVSGDGRLDLVAQNGPYSKQAVFVGLNQSTEPAPWTNLGFGLVGSAGVPGLFGHGTLAAGSAGDITLVNGRPSAPAFLFISVASTPAPFKGGTLAPVPVALLIGVVTDPEGSLVLPWIWPAGVPSGAPLYFQFALQDPAGPWGVSLSNALKAVTP